MRYYEKAHDSKRTYTSHFNRDADTQTLEVVDALTKLPPNVVVKVCGFALAQIRDRRFEQEYEIASSGIQRLIGNPNAPKPPRDDHGRLFFKNGEPVLYVSQPYDGVSETEIQEILAYCKRWGLEMYISVGATTWFPGRTVAICYCRKGQLVYV